MQHPPPSPSGGPKDIGRTDRNATDTEGGQSLPYFRHVAGTEEPLSSWASSPPSPFPQPHYPYYDHYHPGTSDVACDHDGSRDEGATAAESRGGSTTSRGASSGGLPPGKRPTQRTHLPARRMEQLQLSGGRPSSGPAAMGPPPSRKGTELPPPPSSAATRHPPSSRVVAPHGTYGATTPRNNENSNGHYYAVSSRPSTTSSAGPAAGGAPVLAATSATRHNTTTTSSSSRVVAAKRSSVAPNNTSSRNGADVLAVGGDNHLRRGEASDETTLAVPSQRGLPAVEERYGTTASSSFSEAPPTTVMFSTAAPNRDDDVTTPTANGSSSRGGRLGGSLELPPRLHRASGGGRHYDASVSSASGFGPAAVHPLGGGGDHGGEECYPDSNNNIGEHAPAMVYYSPDASSSSAGMGGRRAAPLYSTSSFADRPVTPVNQPALAVASGYPIQPGHKFRKDERRSPESDTGMDGGPHHVFSDGVRTGGPPFHRDEGGATNYPSTIADAHHHLRPATGGPFSGAPALHHHQHHSYLAASGGQFAPPMALGGRTPAAAVTSDTWNANGVATTPGTLHPSQATGFGAPQFCASPQAPPPYGHSRPSTSRLPPANTGIGATTGGGGGSTRHPAPPLQHYGGASPFSAYPPTMGSGGPPCGGASLTSASAGSSAAWLSTGPAALLESNGGGAPGRSADGLAGSYSAVGGSNVRHSAGSSTTTAATDESSSFTQRFSRRIHRDYVEVQFLGAGQFGDVLLCRTIGAPSSLLSGPSMGGGGMASQHHGGPATAWEPPQLLGGRGASAADHPASRLVAIKRSPPLVTRYDVARRRAECAILHLVTFGNAPQEAGAQLAAPPLGNLVLAAGGSPSCVNMARPSNYTVGHPSCDAWGGGLRGGYHAGVSASVSMAAGGGFGAAAILAAGETPNGPSAVYESQMSTAAGYPGVTGSVVGTGGGGALLPPPLAPRPVYDAVRHRHHHCVGYYASWFEPAAGLLRSGGGNTVASWTAAAIQAAAAMVSGGAATPVVAVGDSAQSLAAASAAGGFNTTGALKAAIGVGVDRRGASTSARRPNHNGVGAKINPSAAAKAVQCFIELQYCPYGTLAQLAEHRRQFGPPRWHEVELWSLLAQASLALEYLHAMHIAHVDFKPDNLLIDEELSYRLGDFGSALLLDPQSKRPMRLSYVGSLPGGGGEYPSLAKKNGGPLQSRRSREQADRNTRSTAAGCTAAGAPRSMLFASVTSASSQPSLPTSPTTGQHVAASRWASGGLATAAQIQIPQPQQPPHHYPSSDPAAAANFNYFYRSGVPADSHSVPRRAASDASSSSDDDDSDGPQQNGGLDPTAGLDECSVTSQDEGDSRYVAHDMLNEKLDFLKGDIFSLGMTLYELMTGEPLPHNGDGFQRLRWMRSHELDAFYDRQREEEEEEAQEATGENHHHGDDPTVSAAADDTGGVRCPRGDGWGAVVGKRGRSLPSLGHAPPSMHHDGFGGRGGVDGGGAAFHQPEGAFGDQPQPPTWQMPVDVAGASALWQQFCFLGYSRELTQLVGCMLHRDPARRPSATEILYHPWLSASGANNAAAAMFFDPQSVPPPRAHVSMPYAGGSGDAASTSPCSPPPSATTQQQQLRSAVAPPLLGGQQQQHLQPPQRTPLQRLPPAEGSPAHHGRLSGALSSVGPTGLGSDHHPHDAGGGDGASPLSVCRSSTLRPIGNSDHHDGIAAAFDPQGSTLSGGSHRLSLQLEGVPALSRGGVDVPVETDDDGRCLLLSHNRLLDGREETVAPTERAREPPLAPSALRGDIDDLINGHRSVSTVGGHGASLGFVGRQPPLLSEQGRQQPATSSLPSGQPLPASGAGGPTYAPGGRGAAGGAAAAPLPAPSTHSSVGGTAQLARLLACVPPAAVPHPTMHRGHVSGFAATASGAARVHVESAFNTDTAAEAPLGAADTAGGRHSTGSSNFLVRQPLLNPSASPNPNATTTTTATGGAVPPPSFSEAPLRGVGSSALSPLPHGHPRQVHTAVVTPLQWALFERACGEVAQSRRDVAVKRYLAEAMAAMSY